MAGEPQKEYTVRCLLCDQTVTGRVDHHLTEPCSATCANAVRVDFDPVAPRVIASDLRLVAEVHDDGSEDLLGG